MPDDQKKPLTVVIDIKGDERLDIPAELKKIESNLIEGEATDKEKENLLNNIHSAHAVSLSCRGASDIDELLQVYFEEQE